MSERGAIVLWGSDEVLVHADGSCNIKVLERILYDANLWDKDRSELIITTNEKKAENFNSTNPNLEKIEYEVPLQQLFDLYNEIQIKGYKKLIYDEKGKLQFR